VVFHDTFNSAATYASYKPLNGATVTIGGVRLTVSVSDASGQSGLRFRLPAGGTGVRCAKFDGFDIAGGPIGSRMVWTWFGLDDLTGQEVVVLQTTIEKTGSFTVVHKKQNGTTVSVHIPDKDWKDVKSKRWDTRRGGKQVQLEIEWKDGTKYSSSWMDPSASTIAGFDVTTDLPEFSIDDAEGSEVHMEAAVDGTVALAPFDLQVPRTAPLHWLLETKDADHIVAATVDEVGEPVRVPGGQGGARLTVSYRLDEELLGTLGAERFTVLHSLGSRSQLRRFQPGSSLLLFLRRGEEGEPAAALSDFGRPAGVIPDSAQNRRAVAARVELIHGGLSHAPSENE